MLHRPPAARNCDHGTFFTQCPLHVARDSERHQFCRLVDPCRVATLERREKQCHAAPSAAPVAASGFLCQCVHTLQLCSARTQLKCLCSTTIRPLGASLSARAPLPSAVSIAQHRPALDHYFIPKPPVALFFSSAPIAFCPNLNLNTTHG
jgi:hypothetical protein